MAKRARPDTSNKPSEPPADMNPFLKITDISPEGDTLRLTGWVMEKPGGFGPQVVMEVHHERLDKTFDFGIGVGSMNHRRLFREFGPDYKTWGGKSITVRRGAARGKTFVEIEPVPF